MVWATVGLNWPGQCVLGLYRLIGALTIGLLCSCARSRFFYTGMVTWQCSSLSVSQSLTVLHWWLVSTDSGSALTACQRWQRVSTDGGSALTAGQHWQRFNIDSRSALTAGQHWQPRVMPKHMTVMTDLCMYCMCMPLHPPIQIHCLVIAQT